MAENKKITTIEKSFKENESALKRFLERFFYRADDIEDILQEVFLQTWSIEKKQEIQLPKSYLFAVARNIALKELRKKSALITTYMEEVNTNELLCNENSIENEVDFNKRLILFGKALATLPPRCRSVFVLRKVFGFSQKEIARRMNISVSTVEKHIINGIQRCNAYMNTRGVDDLFASAKRNSPEVSVKEAK